MSIVKTFLYGAVATVDGLGATIESAEGHRVEVGLPPEFRGGSSDAWSGEALLVAAAASSFALTLDAIAKQREIPTRKITVGGTGLVERRSSGRYEFVAIELEVGLEEHLDDRSFRQLAAEARERAVVASALGVPLHVRLVDAPVAAGGVRGPGPRR